MNEEIELLYSFIFDKFYRVLRVEEHNFGYFFVFLCDGDCQVGINIRKEDIWA